jgi:hypothetical protein
MPAQRQERIRRAQLSYTRWLRLGIAGMLQQSQESLWLLNPANDDVEVERTVGSASTWTEPLPGVTM